MSTDNNDAPESIENEEAIEAGADTAAEEATDGDSLEALQEELAAAKDAVAAQRRRQYSATCRDGRRESPQVCIGAFRIRSVASRRQP